MLSRLATAPHYLGRLSHACTAAATIACKMQLCNQARDTVMEATGMRLGGDAGAIPTSTAKTVVEELAGLLNVSYRMHACMYACMPIENAHPCSTHIPGALLGE